MPSLELDRLVATRDLQLERPSRPEFEGLLRSAEARLPDAESALNSMDSRFDLAYNAAHALALAALQGRKVMSSQVVYEGHGSALADLRLRVRAEAVGHRLAA